MSKFDISKFAETLKVSDLDTSGGREQIEYIDLSQIEADPRNFYSMDGLDELAANIELLGLQQPLRVRTSPEDPETVIIVSGHRRRAAIQKLVEDGNKDLALVPCIREVAAPSPALQELRLIYANSDTRAMTPSEISRQAARVEELLYLLKEEGMEFPGRMRDHVAAACRTSAPKLARLKVIRKKLVPEYMGLFEKNSLSEQAAYALARLPEEFQHRLARVFPNPPPAYKAETILKKYEQGWRWMPEQNCPDGKPCERSDTFLRHDCKCAEFEMCGGEKCCLKCEAATRNYSVCTNMCSKAAAQRKKAQQMEKDRDHAAALKRGRNFQKETQRYATRIIRAADAAGLPGSTEIFWRTYGRGRNLSDIRKWAAGEFDDPTTWHSAELNPAELSNAIAVAKILRCSTDYLLGITEDLNPADPPNTEQAAEPEPVISPEDVEETLNNIGPLLDDLAADPKPVLRTCWSDRRVPPEDTLILTYQMTSDGPMYRPAIWTGTEFQSPNRRKTLNGLQYTRWLEIPAPESGEALEVSQPEPEGQLVISGWMPGGTYPFDPCDVVACFRVPDGTEFRTICRFNGSAFRLMPADVDIEAEVVRWMALPPVEEDQNGAENA